MISVSDVKFACVCRSEVSANQGQGKEADVDSLRPITIGDFKEALGKMKESRVYNRQAEALLKMDLD
ncbi:hypothetical protein E2C01_079897 [Portunus trituberculatus]|uniref:Uncharacterized protein n=1 Tax=Portunus trituberculatus TaxID=210409 RepID=A0A5B7IU06_PORTR|nr:hypothetical protein [Portunus trituberculatus]